MAKVERFVEAAFADAEPAHFDWQTAQPLVAERERELVRAAFLPLGQRVLDVGCAEGATLFHLGEPDGAVGVDLFEAKLAFARSRLPKCRFVVGSVYELPFDDAVFDHVIVRDVIHHLDEPVRALRQCKRVLEPGGRIDVLEPCRYSPLILLHALLKREERGELRSTRGFLQRTLAEAGFELEESAAHQALPLHRIVFHPDFGRPSLGDSAMVRAAVDRVERIATRVVPKALWTYLHVRARLPA